MNEEILKELKEHGKWLAFMTRNILKKVIEDNIKTKKEIIIYNLTDGKNSTYDISRKLAEKDLKVAHMTIYNYWKRWFAIGIVIHSEKYSGRFEKIIDLKDLNIRCNW